MEYMESILFSFLFGHLLKLGEAISSLHILPCHSTPKLFNSASWIPSEIVCILL